MILHCGCTADKRGNVVAAQHQDHLYGIGHRVHNESVRPQGPPDYRCTVCESKRFKKGKK